MRHGRRPSFIYLTSSIYILYILKASPDSPLKLIACSQNSSQMAADGVRLIGSWASAYVLRVRIALNIKSVDYEFLQEQLGTKSELLLKSNPVHKKIPVLLHGDKPISESLIIVQYIDEVWSSGPSILPSGPYERAIARFWAAYLDDKWFPALRTVRMSQVEEARKAAIETVKEGFTLLEEAFVKISKGKDFFGGDRIGFVDIALGSNLAWLKVAENISNKQLFEEAKTPKLFKWAEKFSSDPSVKNVIPETDELAELLVAKIKAAQK